MTAKYAIRFETKDGTLEEPYHFMSRKADALKAARKAAKECAVEDFVRIHVDDVQMDVGVAHFQVVRQ